MEKNIGKLVITSYDTNNNSHREFKNSLINDLEFKKYFGEFFLKRIDDIFTNSDSLEVDKAYIVLENDKIIGMIRIFSYHQLGFLNIQYAVNPEYRNQGYGKKILKEVSNYFLNNNNIKCISLDIDKNNIGSIKCALDAGYIFEENKYKLRRN